MTSLEELERPSPIKDMITQVVRTINPKKEFAIPGGGSTPGSGSTPGGGSTPDGGPTPDSGGPSPSPGTTPDSGSTPPPPAPPAPASSPAAPASSPAAPGSSPAAPASSPAAPASSPSGKPDLDLGTPQSKTDGTPEQRAQEARDKAAQAQNPSNMKKWIAAGFAVAAVATILATTLAHFLASDGAEIRLVTIKGEGDSPSYVPSIFTGKPTQVACVWEVRKVGHPGGIASAVRITDKDELEWHDSTLTELDGKNDIKPTKIKGDHEFRVESGLSNSSDIDIKDQGWVKIHTSFDDQLNQTVKDTANAGGDILSSLLNGLTGLNLGTILFIVFCILILVFVFPLISDLLISFTKSNSSNK